MQAGKPSGAEQGRPKFSARRLTRALFSGVILTGCGSLLGIDDAPPASDCVRSEDCAIGFECQNFRCMSATSGEGGEAGQAGQAHGGMSGSGGLDGKGGSAGSFAAGGEAGDDAGTAGRNPFATGGNAGSSGRGGASGHAGDEGGAGGEPPTEVGGGGAGGERPLDECAGSECRKCDEEGRVIPGTECTHACREDICVLPPSCNGNIGSCGSNVSCCLSYPVYGGSFSRSCDDKCPCETGPYPANIASFSLDAFEVTVGRFRRFVSEYATAQPATESGKNPKNEADSGWQAQWNEFLPSTREALIEQLTSPDCAEPHTFNETNDSLPVNCVSWYLAQAFCIWDGGRLPTQAEWNFAASGGDEQRTFPWSSPPNSTLIDDSYAVYGEGEALPERPASVGTHPKGAGRWLQEDLSGNVWEWVFDDHEDCYSTPNSCNNCGSASGAHKTARGGGYWDAIPLVMASGRIDADGRGGYADYGFRCARNL